MILLWGLSGDDPLDEVGNALNRRGERFTLLDQRDLLETDLSLDDGDLLPRVVKTPRTSLDLTDVTSVYLRLYDWRTLPDIAEVGPESDACSRALSVENALRSWVETTTALVVNRPSAMTSNSSKPYQAQIIRDHGFRVPDTLITTDPQAVKEFRNRYESIVYKSISGVRSVVSQFTDDHLSRLQMLAWCPTQFQERIPGHDYRINIAGSRLFSCEIISGADDYRYAGRCGSSLEVRACELPAEISSRALDLAASLGLHAAGVDLRRTPSDEWYCFEVNASPGFTFYQSMTGQPIADAMADLLANDAI